MNRRVDDVGVDAGMIMIADEDYYIENNGKVDWKLAKLIELDPGSYDVKWEIQKTWEGPIEGRGVVEITSGKMVISDPCYNIRGDNWRKWLDNTYDRKCCGRGIIIIDKMGGDGDYSIELEINKR